MTANVKQLWPVMIGSARIPAITRHAEKMLYARQDLTQPIALVWRVSGGIHMIDAGSTSAWWTLTVMTPCDVRATSVLIHVSVRNLLIALLRDIVASASAYQIIQEIHMALHVDQVSPSLLLDLILTTVSILTNIFLVPEPVVEETGCLTDGDCLSKEACFDGECHNPCLRINPCTSNAECVVKDELPLRVMICTCNPGYTGKGDVQCDLISKLIYTLADSSKVRPHP